jgi:protein arginine N-methyltransferase 7
VLSTGPGRETTFFFSLLGTFFICNYPCDWYWYWCYYITLILILVLLILTSDSRYWKQGVQLLSKPVEVNPADSAVHVEASFDPASGDLTFSSLFSWCNLEYSTSRMIRNRLALLFVAANGGFASCWTARRYAHGDSCITWWLWWWWGNACFFQQKLLGIITIFLYYWKNCTRTCRAACRHRPASNGSSEFPPLLNSFVCTSFACDNVHCHLFIQIDRWMCHASYYLRDTWSWLVFPFHLKLHLSTNQATCHCGWTLLKMMLFIWACLGKCK